MPKLGLEPIRRRQLIQATIASIHEDGLAETTVSRISARAGMSPGIVHHYFINKDDLLEATLRSLGVQIRQATRQRLLGVTGPRERLAAIVDAWLATPWGGDRHARRVEKIASLPPPAAGGAWTLPLP